MPVWKAPSRSQLIVPVVSLPDFQTVKGVCCYWWGLLGLEAAKAAFDLDLETHVVEFASRLMPRQIDDAGSSILVSKIEQLGVQVHLNKGNPLHRSLFCLLHYVCRKAHTHCCMV